MPAMNPWDFSGGSSREPTPEEKLMQLLGQKQPSSMTAPPQPTVGAMGGQPALAPQSVSLQIKAAPPKPPKEEKPRKITTAAPMPVPAAQSLNAQNAMQNGVQPVAKGSGLTLEQAQKKIDELTQMLEQKNTESKKEVSTKLLSPDEVKQLESNAYNSRFYKDQAKGLASYEQELQDRLGAKKFSPDLVTPFGDLAHYLSTGVYNNTVKPGMNGEDRDKLILSHYDKLQDDKRDLAKTAVDLFGKQKSGTLESSQGQVILLRDTGKQTDQSTGGVKAEDPNKFAKGGAKGYDPSKDIKELGKARATYGASMINSMKQIDDALREAGINGIAGMDEKSDVPGVGPAAWLSPLSMLTGEGSKLYQSATDLALAKLQMRSGAQASEGEARRYLKQLGLTPTSGKREFAVGLKKLVQESRNQLAADEARFDPRAVQEYKKRPDRVMSTDLDQYIGNGKVGSRLAPPPSSAPKDRSKMTLQELEAEAAARGIK